jgi:hypothetical protein
MSDYPVLIVRMPPPVARCEAHYVGIVLKIDTEADKPPENPDFVYITLEKAFSPDGAEETALCEWRDKDTHCYGGVGPPATDEEFLKALESRV